MTAESRLNQCHRGCKISFGIFSQPLYSEVLRGFEEKQKLCLLNAENFFGLANKLLFQRRSEGLLRCHKLLGVERIRGFRFSAACTRVLLCHASFKAFL